MHLGIIDIPVFFFLQYSFSMFFIPAPFIITCRAITSNFFDPLTLFFIILSNSEARNATDYTIPIMSNIIAVMFKPPLAIRALYRGFLQLVIRVR